MFKEAKPFFIKTITPLHAGSGEELGTVDLPIQRERHTGFPKIESSSLKGALRECFESLKKNDFNGIPHDEAVILGFGPEKGDAQAGALGFTDARLLLFPIKSMKGVFVWITCPAVLKRLVDDLALCDGDFAGLEEFIGEMKENSCSDYESLTVNGNLILEEYTFKVDKAKEKLVEELANKLKELSGIEELDKRLVILSNDDFSDFTSLSTEVITRIKIDNETGAVEGGALFTEEYLPAESILYFLALASPLYKREEGKWLFQAAEGEKEQFSALSFFDRRVPDIVRIGGNATLGKGISKIYKKGGN